MKVSYSRGCFLALSFMVWYYDKDASTAAQEKTTLQMLSRRTILATKFHWRSWGYWIYKIWLVRGCLSCWYRTVLLRVMDWEEATLQNLLQTKCKPNSTKATKHPRLEADKAKQNSLSGLHYVDVTKILKQKQWRRRQQHHHCHRWGQQHHSTIKWTLQTHV